MAASFASTSSVASLSPGAKCSGSSSCTAAKRAAYSPATRQRRRAASVTVYAAPPEASKATETLELTGENVEAVLDEVRPYLIADGGDVELVEIDGLVVRLKLNGACGSCPSSTVTMRMGIERRLMEKIPEIMEVEQVTVGQPCSRGHGGAPQAETQNINRSRSRPHFIFDRKCSRRNELCCPDATWLVATLA